MTALHVACQDGKQDIAKILIDAGADLYSVIKMDSYYTPLHIACRAGHIPIIQLLLDKGVDMNTQGIGNIMCAFTPLEVAIISNKLTVAKFLLDKKAKANNKTLTLACERGTLEAVTLLLERQGWDKKDLIPLEKAFTRDDMDVAMYLINLGVDFNQKDKRFEKFLHDACESGHLPLVRVLVEEKGYGIETPIHIDGHENVRPLHVICNVLNPTKEHFDVVTYLLNKGVNVNAVGRKGNEVFTPLILCRHSLQLTELLIGGGADVNFQCPNGWSALIELVKDKEEEQNIDVCRYLLEKGANVNAKLKLEDKISVSPLQCVLYRRASKGVNQFSANYAYSLVRLLVEKGAEVNTTRDCKSLLEMCIDPDTRKYLTEHGAW